MARVWKGGFGEEKPADPGRAGEKYDGIHDSPGDVGISWFHGRHKSIDGEKREGTEAQRCYDLERLLQAWSLDRCRDRCGRDHQENKQVDKLIGCHSSFSMLEQSREGRSVPVGLGDSFGASPGSTCGRS